MAFLWGATPAQTEFDTLLDKTTSDLLPSSAPVDLSLSLQLADLIRSASLPPSSASKALLQRLKHSNPNVQLLALQVLDVCIKNGGTPFLLQIADKDFSSGLEQLARGSNRDVRDQTLGKIQEWAVAFKGKDNLRDTSLVRTYERIKNEGLPFPAKDPTATAAMVDSLSAPEWQDSSYCTRCRTDFSTFNRKHHCRNCGQVFDAACSSQTAVLPHYGITEQVRICDGCSKKIKEGKGSQVARNQSIKSNESNGKKDSGGKSGNGKSRKDREEEDLKKAIEASLKESSSSSDSTAHGPLRDPPPKAPGYNPSYASQFGSDTKKPNQEEEDPDLAAAIAASLRDIVPPPTAPSFSRTDSTTPATNLTYSQMFPSSHSQQPSSYTQPPRPRISLPNYDLLPDQLETLHQFTSTFTPQHPGPSYLSYQERELARRAVEDQKLLERSLGDSLRRSEVLKELEWKLGEAARLYGAGLTERNMYSPRIQQSHYAPPQSHAYLHSTQTPLVNASYQYHPSSSSISTGQPLPTYSLPSQPQLEPQEEPYHPAQRQDPVKSRIVEPNGFYKPSQFPSVPSTNPVNLEALPHAPRQEPWREEEQEEERRRREEEKVGELIEF